jgi:hypothetical protein
MAETDICNLALLAIGVGQRMTANQTLAANTDATIPAKICKALYAQARDTLLQSRYWRFALTRAALTAFTGTATSGTTVTLVDTGAAWTVNQFAGWYVQITGGVDSGDKRLVISNTATALTVAAWTATPTSTSTYSLSPSSHFGYCYSIPADFLRLQHASGFHAFEGAYLLSHCNSLTIQYVKKITDVTLFAPLFTDALSYSLALRLIPPLVGAGSNSASLTQTIGNKYGQAMSEAVRTNVLDMQSSPHHVTLLESRRFNISSSADTEDWHG